MTFADRMRQAARGLEQFRTMDLANAMDVQTYHERARVRDYVRDFVRRGEFVRISRGLYAYASLPVKATVRQRLWNVIRRMNGPAFTLNDLEQLTDANRETVKQFCSWLVREGYALRVKPGHYRRLGAYEPEVPKSRKAEEKHDADADRSH